MPEALASTSYLLANQQPADSPGRAAQRRDNKCIIQDWGYSINKPLSGRPAIVAGIEPRIVHLPGLWGKYHDQLVDGGNSFWVSMIREAT
jgi:hypothetical protein